MSNEIGRELNPINLWTDLLHVGSEFLLETTLIPLAPAMIMDEELTPLELARRRRTGFRTL